MSEKPAALTGATEIRIDPEDPTLRHAVAVELAAQEGIDFDTLRDRRIYLSGAVNVLAAIERHMAEHSPRQAG